MALQENFQTISVVAAVDLSAQQYRFLDYDASGNGVLAADDEPRPIGVIQDTPIQGQPTAVGFGGVCKVVAEAAIPAGSLIAVGPAGGAKLGAAATAVGKSRTASLAAGEMIEVFLFI